MSAAQEIAYYPRSSITAQSIDAHAVWRTCPDCGERVNAYAFSECTGCGHEACTGCNLAWEWYGDDEYEQGVDCRACRGG